jgi:hypothetical protein
MLYVMLMLCLNTDPSQCKEVRETHPETPFTPYTCQMAGSIDAARRPEIESGRWHIKRWTCSSTRFAEKV